MAPLRRIMRNDPFMLRRLGVLAVLVLALFCGSCGKRDRGATVALTPAEQQWLAQHRDELVFAPDPFYAPFAFYDENSHATRGLAHEYLELVQEKLGLKFKSIHARTFAEILTLAKERKVAIVNAVTPSPERSEYLLFTAPFVEIRNVIIVRQGDKRSYTPEALAGKKVSVVRGYEIAEHLAQTYPAIRFDLVDRELSALLNVAYGLSDAAVMDVASASYLTEKEGITSLRIAGDAMHPISLAIGSRKDWPELCGILNKGLAAISHEERAAIYRRWVTLEDPSFVRNKTFQLGVALVFACLLLSVGTVLLWNKQLKAEVARRTAELSRTNRELTQSEARFRVLVDQAPEAILVYDVDARRFVDANAKAIRLFECSREELLQGGPQRFYASEQSDGLAVGESIERHNQQALAGQPVAFERILRTARGREVNCEVRLVQLPSTGNRLLRASMIDITERKRFEIEKAAIQARLNQSQRLEAIGTLAGGIAHDFNNILSAIVGYTELARFESPEDSEIQGHLEQVMIGAKRATALVRQILFFSRQAQADKHAVQMKALVAEILKFLRATLPMTVSIRYAPTADALVLADPAQLHQIVMNLCTNAGLAMRESGGELEVTLDTVDLDAAFVALHSPLAPGRHARLTVRDTGCGMAPEVQARIFEPFFTTRGVGEGTGLGLSVVHGIVQDLGGAVTVASAVGQGSTFEVYLPLLSDDLAASPEYEAPALPGTARVLFVDDEVKLVELAKVGLERHGYRVTAFTESLQALEALRRNPYGFDIVISDVTMPGLAGDQLVRELRTFRKDLPVVLATGFSERVSPEVLGELGVTELIIKPWTISNLTRLIRKIVHE